MLRFFRTNHKKLIEHRSKGRTGNNVRKYLLYAIGEILLVVIEKTCPIKDYLSVEMKRPKTNHCAVRYNL